MKKFITIFIVLSIALSGCNWINNLLGGINNQTNKVVQVLDNGISTLNSQSANWQDVLNKIITDLPTQASNIVKGDVTNLLQRTVAATSVEVRCDADFFRVRVQQELQQIKAKFLNTPLPPLEPHLCEISPSAIDMSLDPAQRNNIQFYGYDFDITKVEVFLESANGEINVSKYLDQPTHYQMSLNLGSNGINLDKYSQRLILRWNNENISSISVIQPSPKICQTSYDNFTPNNITFIPPHYGNGDADFAGHGPAVTCTVTLINYGDHISARIYMDAKETESDWTEARGTQEYDVYHCDPDKTIESIVSAALASFSYTDTNCDDDYFSGNGFIRSFNFTGDTHGDEAGTKTKVTVAFNSIRVQLKDKGDCVSTESIKKLVNHSKISQSLTQQIKISEKQLGQSILNK